MTNILYDGHKKTNINNLPEEAWEYLRGDGPDSELRKLQKAVPWLYAAVETRANALAAVPFSIYRGTEEIDRVEEWENKIGVLPDPKLLLRKIEQSLVSFGRSYLFQPVNKFGFKKELRYIQPTTIKPVFSEETGLVSFKRTLRGEERILEVDDLVYFWLPDPYIEIGPPQMSAAQAAIAAAGVLMNTDDFAEAFFSRGAIKATILAVPAGTPRTEGEKLQKWYSGLMAGIKNAFTAQVLNAEAVTATVIGEGIEGLENTELTKEKREDISTAFGIPQSKMFSTAATDTNRVEDEKSFLIDTIIPECEFIQEILNAQVFQEMGYRFKFRPESLSILQEDEGERSTAFKNYVDGGLTQKVAAAITGVEVPKGFEIKDKEIEQPVMVAASGGDNRDDKKDEKRKFHRFMKNDKDIDKFVFNFLDETEQDAEKEQYAHTESDMLLKSLTDSLDAVRDDFRESNVYITNEIVTPDVKVDIGETKVDVNVPESEVKNIVQIDVPEQKQTIINVEPTPVVVENKVEAPVVNVTNELPERKPRKTTVKRDDHGNIIEMDTK